MNLSKYADKIEEYLENPNGLPPTAIWLHLKQIAAELRDLSNEEM